MTNPTIVSEVGARGPTATRRRSTTMTDPTTVMMRTRPSTTIAGRSMNGLRCSRMGRRPAHLDRTTSPRPRRHPRRLQIQHIPPRPSRSPGHRRLTSPGTITMTRRPLAIRRRRRSSHLLPRPRPETIITPKPGRRLLPTRSGTHIRGIIHTETRRRFTRIPMGDNRINQIRTRQTRRSTTRGLIQMQTRISQTRVELRPNNICRSLKIRTSQRLTRRQRRISNMTTNTRSRTLRNTMRTGRQWPRLSRNLAFGKRQRSLTRPERKIDLLEYIRTELDDFSPTLDQPTTTRNREISHLGGEVRRFHREAADLATHGSCLGGRPAGPSAGNEIGSDVQRSFGEGCDSIFFPLVPAVFTGLVGCIVETNHPSPSSRGNLMPLIHPGIHIIATEELDRPTQRGRSQQDG